MDAYDQLIGSTIEGKYVLIEKIGQGGMACVFLGQHVLMQREVAVKLMLPQFASDPHFIERFQREAQLASRLRSPNIITTYDFGRTSDGIFYLVMDFVRGRSLSKFLQEHGPLPSPKALEYTRQIARALQTAHREGIVHRDLKPDNIVLTPTPDNGETLQVLDFGIARMVEATPDMQQLTMTGAMVGTPAYMSPEQFGFDDPQGNPLKPDTRSDLYSLGVVLHQLLTGQLPFTGNSLGEFYAKHTAEPPPPLPDSIPPEVRNMVSMMLAKQPSDRFQSADEILTVIQDLLGVSDGGTIATGRSLDELHTRLRKQRSSRHRQPLALAAAILLVLGVGAGVMAHLYSTSTSVLLKRLTSPNPMQEREARHQLYLRAQVGDESLIPKLTALAGTRDAPVSARFHAVAMLQRLKSPKAHSLAKADPSPEIQALADLPAN